MNLRIIALNVFIMIFLIACKSTEGNPVKYNEEINKILTRVDSLRLQIGDREDEKQEETIKDMYAFKKGITQGIKQLDSLGGFKGDTTFISASKNYLKLNRDLLKNHFVIIASIHDKILDNTATEEDKSLALEVNEELNNKLDSANAVVQNAQDLFFKKYRIRSK